MHAGLKPKGTPHVDSHTNIVSHTLCMYEYMNVYKRH
jgi:hypothetical protein